MYLFIEYPAGIVSKDGTDADNSQLDVKVESTSVVKKLLIESMLKSVQAMLKQQQENQQPRQYYLLTVYCLQTVSPRAQGPDWSGAGLHHTGHQHFITLFTARRQQRRPLPTKN